MKKNYESPAIETTILGFSLMQAEDISGKEITGDPGDAGSGKWARRRVF